MKAEEIIGTMKTEEDETQRKRRYEVLKQWRDWLERHAEGVEHDLDKLYGILEEICDLSYEVNKKPYHPDDEDQKWALLQIRLELLDWITAVEQKE
ncbi:hypothetical protein [Gimesia maris]|uniref:hypothetical protein n=1 Tax=Gimesia maris TaxID=122 RepID=UPI0030D99CBF|tara:strand:- start:127954 stop:128241 length:288 start_codon:yes stop_codon:yes gene_type:complete